MKVYQPIVFQGNFNKKRYFEGWYFKHVSLANNHVYSFIPGISLTSAEKHSFIQVIDGLTGKTWNMKYPLKDFRFEKKRFNIWVGQSNFSAKGIKLDIESEDLIVKGEILYEDIVKYPSSAFSPGIMGWYSFVPFMECKHGIASVMHRLKGTFFINGSEIDLTGGTGYIEKDWGVSFPESWIWLHCNTFKNTQASFTFSVAKIPWLGSFFIGHICFLYTGKKFYRFATYNGSQISKLDFQSPTLVLELRNKKYVLKAKAVRNKYGELKAPVTGEMSRIIKESIDSEIEISLFDANNKLIYSDSGSHAGLEIIEKILTYF